MPKAIEHQRESERTLNDLIDQLKPWTDARELRVEAGSELRVELTRDLEQRLMRWLVTTKSERRTVPLDSAA